MSRRLFPVLLVPLIVALVASGGAISHAAAQPDPGPTVLVVNGRPATENYSFMVYVGGCTGSLITPTWAVTAKHCPTPGTVRVGSTNRTSGGTVATVRRAVENPTIDVKLLQLAAGVPHAPAVIPATSGPVGTATRIIGWGQTCAAAGCGGAPVIAHEADTSIVEDRRCGGINGPLEICTNNNNGATGACYGDSGGPQVTQVNGSWQLIGVTSRAGNSDSTCATAPSVYGDLPSIRGWLDQQVGGLPSSPPPANGNLATTATAGASYTSPWESVAAVNDGVDPSVSNDTVNQRWGTWPNTGEQWVELTWSSAKTLRSVQVYFFDDNGGVRVPGAWRLQHWTGSAFTDVSASGGYPIAVNQYNNVAFTPVTTSRLRLVLTSGSASVGVLELKAFA
jgi:snapalysin